jgi:hypothetical protein
VLNAAGFAKPSSRLRESSQPLAFVVWVRTYSARAAAAAAKLLQPSPSGPQAAAAAAAARGVWSLGADPAAATPHTVTRLEAEQEQEHGQEQEEEDDDEGDDGVEGGAEGIPVGAVGQRLALRLPVAALHAGLAEGQDCFVAARLPATIAQEEPQEEDSESSEEEEEEEEEEDSSSEEGGGER